VSLAKAAVIILLMTSLSTVLCSPLFLMAKIKKLVSFQDTMSMDDILICQEVWPSGWRVTYKTCACVFQFLGPVLFVVRSKTTFAVKEKKWGPILISSLNNFPNLLNII
jgi:hypothetical protein